MSSRDKRLLVYLGALLILAAAYFIVGKPFLDKIDALSGEKTQLQQELTEKREAFENKATYEQGIADSEKRIQEIMDRFPEDNADEKSIMFASHAEADIPIWFSQMTFAEETQNLVGGGEVQSASDTEQEQLEENVAAAEGEEPSEEGEGSGSRGDGEGVTESRVGELIGRDTELGLTFQVEYDNFKKFLAYIRDYEDRIVIKDLDISYNPFSDMVSGNLVLSQYAIIGDDRVLPEVETKVTEKGTDNIFKNKNEGGSILDLLADMAAEFLRKITGDMPEEAKDEFGTDYFIKANAVTDNTAGITVGKADDASGKSYITDEENATRDVTFFLTGDSGKYTIRYSIGDSEYEDETEREADGKVYLRVISTERSGKKDDVSVDLHVINESDIPLVVNIEGDDRDDPRINVIERTGEVDVND